MSTTRRTWLQSSASLLAVGTSGILAPSLLGSTVTAPQTVRDRVSKIRYCLNMSTIQGDKVDIQEQVRIAARAGYQGIELWLRDIQRFVDGGGKLADLRKQIQDAGLQVESAIAFGQWIVDDEGARKKGLEQVAKDMDAVTALGGHRIAAPPSGATNGPKLDLDHAADRYRELLELGDRHDCVPQLEVWGFSKNLSHLKEVLYVTCGSNHPKACILPDVYHLYKGGSNFTELGLLSGSRVHVFHMNDYPDTPPRDKINDADRIYPTEGVAPIKTILSTMIQNGFEGVLSLELFNRGYWQQDPNVVAKTGLEKMKAAVALVAS